MADNLIKYLANKGAPVSSQELAIEVLKINDITAESADMLISSMLKDIKRVKKVQESWQIVEGEKSCEILILIKVFPSSVNHWSQIKEIKIAKIRGSSLVKYGFSLDGKKQQHYVKIAKRILQIVREYPIIFDGIGNQKSQFRRFFQNSLALDLTNMTFSYTFILKLIFPEKKMKCQTDISTLLGVESFEQATLDIQFDNFLDQYFVLMELVKEYYGQGVNALFEIDTMPLNMPDYSRYQFAQEFIENIPSKPGVYIMKNVNGEVIYVGKAKRLSARLRSYFYNRSNLDQKINLIRENLYDLEIKLLGSELEALFVEQELIEKHKPFINRQIELHFREKNQKERYERILFCPSERENYLTLYLFRPFFGLVHCEANKDLKNFSEICDKIKGFFFTNGDMKNDPREEILISWLSENSERINSLDMRNVATMEEAVSLVRDHIIYFEKEKIIIFR